MKGISIEALQRRFYQYDFPYWKAYRGKRCIGKYRHDESQADEIIEYSWMQLEDLLNDYPEGGYMRIEMKQNATDPKDRGIEEDVVWGDPAFHSPFTSRSRTPQQTSMNGNWQMMQLLMNIQKSGFENQLESQRSNQELIFENMMLKQEIESASQGDGKIEAIREIAGIASPFIQKIFFPTNQTGALGTLGQKEEIQDEAPKEQGSPVSFDLVIQYVHMIKDAFPQWHIHEILQALVMLSQNQKSMAESVLAPIINQIRNGE